MIINNGWRMPSSIQSPVERLSRLQETNSHWEGVPIGNGPRKNEYLKTPVRTFRPCAPSFTLEQPLVSRDLLFARSAHAGHFSACKAAVKTSTHRLIDYSGNRHVDLYSQSTVVRY